MADPPEQADGAPPRSPRPATELTELLQRWGSGDAAALEALVPRVDRELRRIASGLLRGEPANGTVAETTALVNETYLQLLKQAPIPWEHRRHFFGIAARIMRQILVDHARRRMAKKRGAGGRVEHLTGDVAGPEPGGLGSADLLALDVALEELAALEPRVARVVELRFFGGLTIEETAQAIDVSPDTVKRDWRHARMWLRRELAPHDPKSG